jgi:hypothetical protein
MVSAVRYLYDLKEFLDIINKINRIGEFFDRRTGWAGFTGEAERGWTESERSGERLLQPARRASKASYLTGT